MAKIQAKRLWQDFNKCQCWLANLVRILNVGPLLYNLLAPSSNSLWSLAVPQRGNVEEWDEVKNLERTLSASLSVNGPESRKGLEGNTAFH